MAGGGNVRGVASLVGKLFLLLSVLRQLSMSLLQLSERVQYGDGGTGASMKESNRALPPSRMFPFEDRLPSEWPEIPYASKMPSTSRARVGSSQNRTLVMLLGTLRCGEPAWRSLYRHVLDVNSADLAVLTQARTTLKGGKGLESQTRYPGSSLFERAAYVWVVPSYVDWAYALDLINGTEWRWTVLPRVHPEAQLLGGVGNFPNSNAIVFMFRYWARLVILKYGLHHRYDRFVVTRTDHYYECDLNLTQVESQARHRQLQRDNENTVPGGSSAEGSEEVDDVSTSKYLYVPEGEDYGGITDRFYFTDASNVVASLHILPPFLESNSTYYKWYQRRKHQSNPERVLNRRWKHSNLTAVRFPRMMYVCAAPGDTSHYGTYDGQDNEDSGGGRTGNGSSEGIQNTISKKYPLEYEPSLANCAANQRISTVRSRIRTDRS